MTRTSWVAVLLLALPATPVVHAQEVVASGQVRSRHEIRATDAAGTDGFTSMRVRAALEALIDENLTVFIQMQDVRLWGEETSTLADFRADNLDLHQGYVRYRGKELDWLTTTVGRQETAFGGQRLIGAVGWTPQARSFDGIRFDAARDWGGVSLIGYTLGDETSPNIANDSHLVGAYATIEEVGSGALDVYLLHDRVEGVAPTGQSSIGARYAFAGEVNARFEATWQRGERAGRDVSAYMFGGRVGTSFAEGKGTATLWYDHLSGDDPSTPETEVFSTLYATNHKFYGFADLFTDIPVHTGGAGLRDVAAKVTWAPSERVSIGADLHSFSVAEQGTLAATHFANELDLTVSHRYSPNLVLTTGLSFVTTDDALVEIGRAAPDDRVTWFYVMLDAIF